MEVRPFDIADIPSPWREVLDAEVKRLIKRTDVLAVGIAGSWAQEDTWPHSDLDIEVLLKGERDFNLTIREERGISVDVAFFGENIVRHLPYETRPIHDPDGVMTEELASRNLNEVLSGLVRRDLDSCQRLLGRAEEALDVDGRSTIVFLHLFAWNLSEAFTVASGDNRTMTRRCSRLERAMERQGRKDLLEGCGQLYGFPRTIRHSEDLLSHLREGYKEVWPFFQGQEYGPPYMLQQPDSEAWFRNRIEPLHQHDPRDLVWLVYLEFPDVTWHLSRNLTERDMLPLAMFDEAQAFPEAPRKWVHRHLQCLSLFEDRDAERLLALAQHLVIEANTLFNKEHRIP